ncbi:hypothetical protein N9917_00105 [Deltaproteobacteria bacterium]|nr:hypothetical protein [Deltaproteobacteria bacterium]
MNDSIMDSLVTVMDQGPTKIVMHTKDYKALQAELTKVSEYQSAPPRNKNSALTQITTLFGVEVQVSELVPQGKCLIFDNRGQRMEVLDFDPMLTAVVLSGPYADIFTIDDNEDGTWDAFDSAGTFLMALPDDAAKAIRQAKGWH